MLRAVLLIVLAPVLRGVKITVYQSPLSYYDTEMESGEYLSLSRHAVKLSFPSRFDLLFVNLPFEFPFYADTLTSVGVTRLGFVYTGAYSNGWLAELLHIAPLMNLYSADSGTVSHDTLNKHGEKVFLIDWDSVSINEYQTSFQLQLYSDGRIVMAYKDVPDELRRLGLVSVSSAFPWITQSESTSSHLYYYEFNEVRVETEEISNNTALTLRLRQNCQSATNCTSCMDVAANSQFSCQWCSALNRCSDGFDSGYLEWQEKCDKTETALSDCPASTTEKVPETNDDDWKEKVEEWLDSLINASIVSFNDDECGEGRFYNPYTLSCNDCSYCVSVDCKSTCDSFTGQASEVREDPRRNMDVRKYKFSDFNTDASFWRSAFVGLMCGVGFCLVVGMVTVCMKRRSYSQPAGASWHVPPQHVETNDDKPLMTYGSST